MVAQGEDQFGWPVEAEVAGGSIDVNPTPNRSAAIFETVTIASAGSFVTGPNVTVPDGFFVRAKLRSTQAGTILGLVDNGSTPTMILNKGESIRLTLDNLNRLRFSADTNGAIWELVAEQ